MAAHLLDCTKALLAALLFAPAPAAAKPLRCLPIDPVPDLTAQLEVADNRIALADAVSLTLTVEGPAPLEVEPIMRLVSNPLWQEKAQPPEKSPLLDGRERWRQNFRLEPRAPTPAGQPPDLELAAVRVRRGEKIEELKWAPIQIEVTSTIADPNLDKARGVPPIEELPPLPPERHWLTLVGLVLAGLLGLAGAVWLARSRRRPVPELPPHLQALAELDQIETDNLRAAGDSARCHMRLAEVIRGYLDRRFELRSREQTTPEFFARLPAAPPWSAEAQDCLRRFLERCDLAKFAGVRLPPEECRHTAGLARSFVTVTAPKNGDR